MTTWNDIRAQWVNDERNEAMTELYALGLSKVLTLLKEALKTHLEGLPNGTTHTGDLTDLIEMINFYERRE